MRPESETDRIKQDVKALKTKMAELQNELAVRERSELSDMRRMLKKCLAINEAHQKHIESLAKLVDELSVAPLAALLALADTLDAHSIPKEDFMRHLDETSACLFPDAETLGAQLSTSLVSMTLEPSARRPPPSSTEE